MPRADYQLTNLLGLRPSVKRLMMYQQGCFAGSTVFRLAKDLAKNNTGACVLVVCSEITVVTFCGPSDTHLDSLVGQALFSDGAIAMIVGVDPDVFVERPLFQLVSAAQTILSDSDVVKTMYHKSEHIAHFVAKDANNYCASGVGGCRVDNNPHDESGPESEASSHTSCWNGVLIELHSPPRLLGYADYSSSS
ncbi:hypothetical protein RJ639_032742 [Escallonia herrerae]|uniref:Chalcone/stilbene synthase N-terminal domain-containing protein n=1 Tax=Escallonia herrerae TaxID=1293975 RepID=A0AA88WSY1_9ASTE|nr:hypothetical protein RJ639_032742 [Escallonia herrerae]